MHFVLRKVAMCSYFTDSPVSASLLSAIEFKRSMVFF